MSVTHRVQALQLQGTEVMLQITIVHVDEDSFCLEPNCVLQMLWQAGGPWNPSEVPLHAEMSVGQLLDPAWLLANTARFIASVKPVGGDRQPASSGEAAADASRGSGQPSAAAKVVVTDPRWLAHIEPGQSWDSAPYDARGYV